MPTLLATRGPPGRCLAPIEASCFASDCVRFIRCLAPMTPGKTATLLATRGPLGRCRASMETVPGTYGDHYSFASALAWQNDRIDDMDHTVGAVNVSRNYRRIVNHYFAIFDCDLDRLRCHRGGCR